MIKIAVIGYGVVGSGVCQVLDTNADIIANNAKNKIEVKYILDIRDFPDSPFKDKFTKSFDDILYDSEVSIVVETMGGLTPAYEFTRKCLFEGKSVITSNKELVATHGAELLKIAQEKNVNYLFEASVGGGIPIIRPLSQCLAANSLNEIYGILNGTTNYILTEMINRGVSFEDALSEAKAKGYAEANPTADIEGHDVGRKICILASLAFGNHVYPSSITMEGITKITLRDVEFARNAGKVIKLLGRAIRQQDGKLIVYCGPHLVDKSCQISTVDGVFNAIMVKGNAIGDVMFYGPGAGKLPTASAVVADIIDAAKHIGTRKLLEWKESSGDILAPLSENITRFYVRIKTLAENEILSVFKNATIIRLDGIEDEIAFITEEGKEGDLSALTAILSEKTQILSQMRVL